MTVIRRLDCLLESTKAAVLKENDYYEKMEIYEKSGLTEITKYPFSNTSRLETLVEHNRLYSLIQKFTDADINLSPEPVYRYD